MTTIDIPCDVQQVDATGFVWAFLDEAVHPGSLTPGAIVVAGDVDEPVMARVVDITNGLVHLDILPGAATLYADAVQRNELADASWRA